METGQLILPNGSSLAGRYEIVGVIGLGGMAVVYEAIQLDLGRPVAIKVLSQRLAADEAFRRRFRREAEHAAALDHPNIVTIHDFGEAEERPYLAMSLIRGRTLADELANGPLAGERTIEVLEALGAALDHAHGRRVLHRDVKPQNVLLDDSGGIFLADFGISKGIGGESVTATGGLLGTVRYAAPEQIRGAAIGPAADLYSLAVLAYECLTGTGPYLATSDLRLLAAHLDEPPLAFDDGRARGRANEALVAALSKNPGDRPGTIASFVGRLREAMDAEPASLTSTPAFKQRRPELVQVDVDDWLQDESGGDTADLPAISDAVAASPTTTQRKRLARSFRRRWPVGLALLSFALPAALLSTPPPDTRQLTLGRDGPSLRVAGDAVASTQAAVTWGELIPGFKPTGLVEGAGRVSEETVLTESAGQTVPLAPTESVASRLVSVAGGTVRKFDTGDAVIGVGQSDQGAVLFGCRYGRAEKVGRCDTELATLSVGVGQLRADPVPDVASELARAFRMLGQSSRSAVLPAQDATRRRTRAEAMSKAYVRAASVVEALSTRRTFDGDVAALKVALSRMAGGYKTIAEAARRRSLSRDQSGRGEVRDGTRDLATALRSLAARGYEVGDET